MSKSRKNSAPKEIPIPPTLPPELVPIWEQMLEQVDPTIGSAGMESLVIQISRLRDAQARISREGSVVADSKGNPGPHPALAIEQQAGREIREWMKNFPRKRSHHPNPFEPIG